VATRVGYTGGDTPAPTYDSVCDGDGHTEAIRVTFDPAVLTYEQLLVHFWDVSGSRAFKRRPKAQYKSAVWVVDEDQRAAVDASIAQLCSSSIGDEKEVVTEVLEFQSWADAEERHQNYMRKHRAAKATRAADAQQWVNAWGGREGGR